MANNVIACDAVAIKYAQQQMATSTAVNRKLPKKETESYTVVSQQCFSSEQWDPQHV